MLWKLYKRLLKLFAKHIPGYRTRLLKMASYEISKQVYIGEDLIIIDELDDKKRVKIGDRVTIAERVTLILNRQIRNFAAIIAKKSSKGHQAVEFFMSNMTLYERLSSVALLNKVNMGNIGLFGLR